ncbi:hypothetical protein D3OALGA1CA_3320 [Olavius algarvensis associated proteobacterium Delta 3]|nr:hypothetical protein D3OALGB2SA_1442 [Olavius algarvensis associated proteobacterium Delta 3]CAB5132523.1 hypothetical protein D3OALGA1CA_3320 [Olavius algarvensis associated proteobacterium Delta 3]
MKTNKLCTKIVGFSLKCGLFAIFLNGIFSCASPQKFALPPPELVTTGIELKKDEVLVDKGKAQTQQKIPDIIVTDMWFVFGEFSDDAEFPYQSLDLRVSVKNIGTEKAKFRLLLFKTDPTKGVGVGMPTGIVFEQQSPGVEDSLDVGEEKVYEWKSVGNYGDWPGYFLAVADIPTTTWRLGQVKEGPLPMAEKNNTMAIPFPTKW